MKGTVKWFNRIKGYGFVLGDDGNEYFIHYTALPKNVVLNENDKVEFEPGESEKGKIAKDVKLDESASSDEAPQETVIEEKPEETSEDTENF